METNPEKINDFERQIEQRVFTIGENYAARNKRSKVENKDRAEDRAKIKEIGFEFPAAFHQAIKLIKDLSPRELVVWRDEFEMTLRIMGSRQADLFADEQMKAAKREKKKSDAAEAAKAASLEANDANPRSDPSSGGAGKKKSGDNPLTAEEVAAQEQIDGEAITKDAGKPKSQSQQAKEALEAAKLGSVN